MYLPYQRDEVMSALHKSLRKGDIPLSCYFAKCIEILEGLWKVKQYILFIVYEETLSVELYKEAIRVFQNESATIREVYDLIGLFCKAPKKWETEQGRELTKLHLMVDIMYKEESETKKRNYAVKKLDKFSMWLKKLEAYDKCYSKVRKNYKKTVGDDLYTTPEIFTILAEGIDQNDIKKVLLMSYYFYENRDKFPIELLDIYCNNPYSKELLKSMLLMNGKYCYAYNYIVLFYSFLYNIPMYSLQSERKEKLDLISVRADKALRERRFVQIPLYAYDNHTRKGKDLLSKSVVDYGIKQDQIDLRLSGSWLGVIWGVQAVEDYKTIEKNWEEVKVPKEVKELVERYYKLKE